MSETIYKNKWEEFKEKFKENIINPVIDGIRYS